MTGTIPSSEARPAGLTRDRIISAAIELLDAHGERGLTFRSLAHELRTGHGAIQWHVANKSELLAAATVTVVARALEMPVNGTPPRQALHAIALGVFDAMESHAWLGAQLFAVPWQSAMAQLWEHIGRHVEGLGVPETDLFTGVSTLVSYIVGVGSQNAVNAELIAGGESRDRFLGRVADEWESADLTGDGLLGRLAARLRVHDDRAEFLAGIDIVIAGLVSAR